MHLTTRLVLGFAIAAVPTSAMATIFFPFDTESELTSNFAANRNGIANGNFTFDPVGGIGGTGGVMYSGITFPEVPPNGFDATNVMNTPIPVQDGKEYIISTMFKSTPNGSWGGSWRFVQLGLVNRADRSFNGELGDAAFIAPRLNSNFNVQFQTKNLNGGPSNINGPSNAAPEYQLFGNWLKFSVSIKQTDTTAGTFDYSMSIQDFGVDGVTPGIFFNVPAAGTITLGGLANQPLYPAFRSAGPFAGDPPALPAPVFYDNFSVANPSVTPTLVKGDFGGNESPDGSFNTPDNTFDGLDIEGFLLALNNESSYLALNPTLSAASLITLGDFGGNESTDGSFNTPDGAFDGLDIEGFLLALNNPAGYAGIQPPGVGGVSAIPEPAALGILPLAGALLARRRR